MNNNDFNIAWENAIVLTNREPNQYRMCYICQEIMNHGNKWDSVSNPNGGINIDHINGNHKDSNYSNIVIVHYQCNVEKGNQDFTKKYREIKNQKWSVKED